MKVLFVSSGNKKNGISPIVRNQGESLQKQGIRLEYFTVGGKGPTGYLKHWFPLVKTLRRGNYDIIHAHYSLCGFLATLAAPYRKDIVVSLMGTFRPGTLKYHMVRFLAMYRWKKVIVKSERMKGQIGLPEAHIIPNGVNVEKFRRNQSREEIRKELGFQTGKKIVIFVSNPDRPEKNFPLCRAAVSCLGRNDVELLAVYNKSHEEVAKYMLAADVLMLTSYTEGSPNVIKEAMAANCPIVCTKVGDVEYLLEGVAGAYIMDSFLPEEGAALLDRALSFGRRTEGLNKLVTMGLHEKEVADRIIRLYTS